VPDPLNLWDQFVISSGACAAQIRIVLLRRMAPIARGAIRKTLQIGSTP
jgi:hypothetical protein